MALADVHRVLARRRPVRADDVRTATAPTIRSRPDDDLPGRLFTWWQPAASDRRRWSGAGFVVESTRAGRRRVATPASRPRPRRRGRCPTTWAPGMRLLCCGLNPSLHAADAGIGYVTGPATASGRRCRDAGLATRRPRPAPPAPRRPHRHDRPREAGHRPGRTSSPTAEYRDGRRAARHGCALAPAAGDLRRRPGRLAGRRSTARRRSAGSPATLGGVRCT